MSLNQMAYSLILCFVTCKGHLNHRQRNLLENLNLFETNLLIILNTIFLYWLLLKKSYPVYTSLKVYQRQAFLKYCKMYFSKLWVHMCLFSVNYFSVLWNTFFKVINLWCLTYDLYMSNLALWNWSLIPSELGHSEVSVWDRWLKWLDHPLELLFT